MLIKVLGVSNEIPFCSVSRLCCISCLFYHLSRLLSVGMMTWWWCLAMGVATLLSSCETAVLRHGVQQVFHPSPRNSRQIDLSYPDLSYHPLPTSEYFGPNYVPTTSDDNYGDNIPHPKFLYVANLANAAAVYKTIADCLHIKLQAAYSSSSDPISPVYDGNTKDYASSAQKSNFIGGRSGAGNSDAFGPRSVELDLNAPSQNRRLEELRDGIIDLIRRLQPRNGHPGIKPLSGRHALDGFVDGGIGATFDRRDEIVLPSAVVTFDNFPA